MSTKPITNPTTYVTLSGNQSAGLFDGSFAPVYTSINDVQTYQNYIPDTGAANAYVLVLPAGWLNGSGLAVGLQLQWKAANTNTLASTLDFNGTGATPIKRIDGTAIAAGDIVAGGICVTQFDGTNWQLLNPLSAVAPASGSFVWLARRSALIPAATLSFTSLISATYDTYKFVVNNIIPQTNNTHFYMVVSEDNGANWKTGGADYTSAVLSWYTSVDTAQVTSSHIYLSSPNWPVAASGANDDINGEVTLFSPLGTQDHKIVQGRTSYVSTANNNQGTMIEGRYIGTRNAIDAVRFQMSLGNMQFGTIDMYGLLPS